jgi:RHS repeat-associated protein
LDVTQYNYSSRGELLSATLPDGTLIEYVHDPLGRRIAKKMNGIIVEKYLWQGLTRLLAVYDGSDNLIRRFEYADARMPVAMTSGGTTYYLTYDQVGSLRVVAEASGNVVKTIDYDSFGNIINDTNPLFEIPFGFAGGLQDRDTGLVRFGFRDYDPDIGRWTAKDPIGFAGGDTDLFGYCLNDPINWTDPDGLLVVPGPTGVVGGAIVGGIGGAITGGISGAEHGGVTGAIGGAIGGAIIGTITGGIGGFITGTLGGGTTGAVAGSLAGTVIGEMLSPTPLDQAPLPSPCS